MTGVLSEPINWSARPLQVQECHKCQATRMDLFWNISVMQAGVVRDHIVCCGRLCGVYL